MTNTDNSIVAKPSKAQTVEKLLKRTRGATMAELMAETSWQNHSVRAFLSGLRKRGKSLTKGERKGGEVSYRLATVKSSNSGPGAPEVEV